MYPMEPQACAELIRESKSTVVLSGAGISTAAGIPDFRGPGGLYTSGHYDPDLVFQIEHFRREPGYFYRFTRDFLDMLKEITPTFTHGFLAGLERAGLLDGIITQNIDILHQVAGSRKVLELHGSYRSSTCQSCGEQLKERDYGWWFERINASPCPPVAFCPSCGGVLKPDIVFFGESVNGYDRAEAMVGDCDLLLVLGSSLNVTPASLLPHCTRATTIVVNRGDVMLPATSRRFFVQEDLDVYFLKVAGHLGLD